MAVWSGICMRRFLPSLSALQAFDAAAHHLSFTRAAEDLGITQSGISRQIAGLEDLLGLKLFERTGSRLALTELGARFADDVRDVLDRLEEATIDMVRGRRRDASLFIAADTTCAARWLSPRLGGFLAQRAIPVEVMATPQDVDFGDTRIDLAILRGNGHWRDARATELFREELVVIGAPSVFSPGARPAAVDFDSIPTLQNAGRPNVWLNWLRQSGTPHRGTIQGIRFAHSDMLISAVVSGLGLAVVPLHYVRGELAAGVLNMPFGPPVKSSESYWAVTPAGKSGDEKITAFRDWLLKVARSGL